MDILISGAGIAGSTLAYWLGGQGHRVTLLERSATARSSGAPVDVVGPALAVVAQMGIVPRLREAATCVEGMSFVDPRGRPAVRVDTSALQRAQGREDIELPRGDLASILADASRDRAALVYGDSIRALAQDAGGVDVTFEHGAPRRFDLVVGADGLHSNVRRLCFGAEEQFVDHQGLCVATLPVPGGDVGRDVVMFNAPGRSLTVHPSRGKAMAAFIFWSPAVAADPRRCLADTFAGDGWRVPELVAAAQTTPDLYFDGVSRVTLPTWSAGRVVLLGDAASCVSLFGNGSTLAIAGAHTLAQSLAEHDLPTALARYEQSHRKRTLPNQKGMSFVASLLVPRTGAGIAIRNAALQLWPVLAAVSWVRQSAARLNRASPRKPRIAS